MLGKQTKLLIVTNLYPTAWAPNRASFNKQQFDRLSKVIEVKIIILVPFIEWLKQRKYILPEDNKKYVPYFYIPKIGRRFYPISQFLSLVFNYRWIKRFSPDVILASWGYPDAIATSMLNRFLKKPFFIKIHGSDINESSRHPARAKQIVKHFNGSTEVFSVSKALRKVLIDLGVEPSKIVVNYNGVDKSIFFPSYNKKTKTIIFVGNLIKEKGILELLSAFDKLGDKYNKYQLRIVGQGPLHDLLVDKYAHSDERIKFLGSLPLDKVAHEIRSAELLVLPSYREGVPNVLLEALSSGTPVVATNVGGIPEVINPNCGIVISDLDLLQDAITMALDRRWSSEYIVDYAQQFDWDKNIDTVLHHIENSVSKV